MKRIPLSVVLREILLKLPAKSLARFKSVDKQWNETISNNEFIKTHSLLQSSPSSRSVLATNYEVAFTCLDFGDYPNLFITEFVELFPEIATYLVDSCNGLAFLICSNGEPEELPDRLLRFDYHFVVYNPVLGPNSFVQINHPPQFLVANNNNDYVDAQDYNFGFGYVSSADDYYIVAINFLSKPEVAVVIHVYSFKTREWRRKDETKILIRKFEDLWYNRSGILINENMHWGISIPFTVGVVPIEGFAIGVLDLAHFGNPHEYEFRTMQLPYPDFGEAERIGGCSAFSLCCLDDCLCAWSKYDNGKELDMWKMTQYGVHESWTRLFRLDLAGFCGQYCGITNFFGYNKRKMALILAYIDELMLAEFNLDPPVYTHIDFDDQIKAVNYVQSFISPLTLSLE